MGSISRKFFNWERLPFGLIYAPLSIYWVYFIIKSRHIWWFVPSNPTLEFAGFDGEGKKEMYSQLPDWSIPRTVFIEGQSDVEQVFSLMQQEQIQYPIITKPDRSMQGVLFRIIDTKEQLIKYHKAVPYDYIIQSFIDYPIELSLFYIRYPDDYRGKITGFIMKEYMQVKGDGKSDLLTLIKMHPKAKSRMDEMRYKHSANFELVLAEDEIYFLSYAGNHNRGAKFINLEKEIDEPLLDLMARIGHHAKYFYYGRYDIKCKSIEELKEGKNFAILEYNGAGAEPNHIYDCGMGLREAYRVIINHWKDLYNISRINYKNGIKYWNFVDGCKFMKLAKKNFKSLQQIDLDLKL